MVLVILFLIDFIIVIVWVWVSFETENTTCKYIGINYGTNAQIIGENHVQCTNEVST